MSDSDTILTVLFRAKKNPAVADQSWDLPATAMATHVIARDGSGTHIIK